MKKVMSPWEEEMNAKAFSIVSPQREGRQTMGAGGEGLAPRDPPFFTPLFEQRTSLQTKLDKRQYLPASVKEREGGKGD